MCFHRTNYKSTYEQQLTHDSLTNAITEKTATRHKRIKDQFRVVDVTSEVRRKSANMKKPEPRRIANAHFFFRFSR
jgi:hypothetical protein